MTPLGRPTRPTEGKASDSRGPGSGRDPGAGRVCGLGPSAHPGRQRVGRREQQRTEPVTPPPAPRPALGIHADHRAAHPGGFEASGAQLSCQGFVLTPPLRLAAWELGSDRRAAAAFEVPGAAAGSRRQPTQALGPPPHPRPGAPAPGLPSLCPMLPTLAARCLWGVECGGRKEGAARRLAPQPLGPSPNPNVAQAPRGRQWGQDLVPLPRLKIAGLGFVESPRGGGGRSRAWGGQEGGQTGNAPGPAQPQRTLWSAGQWAQPPGKSQEVPSDLPGAGVF